MSIQSSSAESAGIAQDAVRLDDVEKVANQILGDGGYQNLSSGANQSVAIDDDRIRLRLRPLRVCGCTGADNVRNS